MAARTLDDMAAKGYTKATAKDASIKASWAAAKERCISNYGKLPFGPTRKANHAAAVRAASHRTPDSDNELATKIGISGVRTGSLR
jgi:hypothetical protein